MPFMTPEEVEGLRRSETLNAALPTLGSRLTIQRGLQGGSYPNEESGNGQYDDDTGEWTSYLRYGVDAYNSGLGMAP